MSRFLLRAAGLTLLVGGAAILGFARPMSDESGFGGSGSWGWGAIPCLLWAMAWSLVLGAIGYRSLQTALRCEPREMLKVILSGLFFRVFVLAASQIVVYVAYGAQWGMRALLATTLFYLLVLGVEVYSIVAVMRSSTTVGTVTGGPDGSAAAERE